MVVPNHTNWGGLQKPTQRLRTPLVAMPCTVLGQSRRKQVGSRLVRRRRTQVVAIHRIAEKQKEIELLGAHHIEDGVAGSATPATSLSSQIPAPGKSHGHMTVRIGERRKFRSCRH